MDSPEVDDERHRQHPRLALLFVYNAVKRMEPALGGSFKFVKPAQNMKGNDSTVQDKTKHTKTHR